jgi:NTE family protein
MKFFGATCPSKTSLFGGKKTSAPIPTTLKLGLHYKSVRFPGGLNAGQQVSFILDRAALPYSDLKNFDELPVPFRCVATDLETGAAHVFQDGSLSEALRATMSLPAIFTPVVTSDGKVSIDGGLINNLPVDIVKAMGADIVIAIYLQTSPFDIKAPQSLFSLSGSAVSVMIAANEKHNMEVADIVVTVNVNGYSTDDYNKGDLIADQGFAGAEKKPPCLRVSQWKTPHGSNTRQGELPVPSATSGTAIRHS